jgi:hypothetical protein
VENFVETVEFYHRLMRNADTQLSAGGGRGAVSSQGGGPEF